jgi:SAM-dependent methyltransferase
VASAINDTVLALEEEQEIDWSRMLDLIHLTGMEKSLKSQYQNASNLSARIRLHKEFSVNPQGWFPWIYEVCDGLLSDVPDRQILELGCGNGALWTENIDKLPASGIRITLSDISEGMIRDVRRTIGTDDARFDFATFDCHKIPFADASFDLAIANHVLFYCEDIGEVCREVRRVLKPGGVFVCSAYGSSHMMEITRLVQEFDPRIVLSGEKLYERFGLENGTDILADVFSSVEIRRYEDEIRLDQAEILIEYILSCHGNQNQYLLDRYHDFRSFVEKKVKKGFHITKDAGVFVCRI